MTCRPSKQEVLPRSVYVTFSHSDRSIWRIHAIIRDDSRFPVPIQTSGKSNYGMEHCGYPDSSPTFVSIHASSKLHICIGRPILFLGWSFSRRRRRQPLAKGLVHVLSTLFTNPYCKCLSHVALSVQVNKECAYRVVIIGTTQQRDT